MKISNQFLPTLLLLTFAIFLLIGLAASGEQLGSFGQLYQQQQTQGGPLTGQQSPDPAMQPGKGQLSIGSFNTPKSPYTQQGALSLSLGGSQTKGQSKAPVTLVEYSDFTCYYCGRFYRETLPDLVKNYIDTGKIYFMYRDFPRNNGVSLNTIMAARCAGEQGKYWPMHGKNYDGKRKWGVSDLKNIAKGLGVDTKKFDDCFDTKKYQKEIDNDWREGRKAGLRGVPHFVMFDTSKPSAPYTVIPGAFPYAKFAAEADKLLAKGGGGKKPGPPSKPKKPSPPGKKTPSGKIGQDFKDNLDRTPQDKLKKVP